MSDQYTTLTVDEYMHMKTVILALRGRVQQARQHLEKNDVEKALVVLRMED